MRVCVCMCVRVCVSVCVRVCIFRGKCVMLHALVTLLVLYLVFPEFSATHAKKVIGAGVVLQRKASIKSVAPELKNKVLCSCCRCTMVGQSASAVLNVFNRRVPRSAWLRCSVGRRREQLKPVQHVSSWHRIS